MTLQELINIANYYINNDITLEKLAAMNGISKSTLVRYFSEDGHNDICLDGDLKKAIAAKKKKNWLEGKSTYGNQGHVSFTNDELISIAKLIIESDYTLKEIANNRGVSTATIYNLLTEERIGIELYLQLQETYQKHKEKFDKGSSKK